MTVEPDAHFEGGEPEPCLPYHCDQTEDIARFTHAALRIESHGFKAADIPQIIVRFRDHEGFFADFMELFELHETAFTDRISGMLDKVLDSMKSGTPPEAVAAALKVVKNNESQTAISSIFGVCFGSHSGGAEPEIQEALEANIPHFVSRVVRVVELAEAAGDTHVMSSAFFNVEAILTHSPEPAHDLSSLIHMKGNPEPVPESASTWHMPKDKVTPEDIAAYYSAGHRFFYSDTCLLREPPEDTDQIVLLRGLSKQANMPSPHVVKQTVSTVLRLEAGLKDNMVGLFQHACEHNAGATCAPLVTACTEYEGEQSDLERTVAVLSKWDQATELGIALGQITQVIGTTPDFIEEATDLLDRDVELPAGTYRNGNELVDRLAALEDKLLERQVSGWKESYWDKSIVDLRADFLDPEPSNPDAVPVDESKLDDAIALYERIDERTTELEEAATGSLEPLEAAVGQLVARYQEASTSDDIVVDDEFKVELLAHARVMFAHLYGMKLFNTQMVGLILIINQFEENAERQAAGEEDAPRGVYQQYKTGEGKSPITTFFTSYMSILGKRGYISTSNHYLALRDKIKYRRFRSGLGIGCEHFAHANDHATSSQAPRLVISTNSTMVHGYLIAKLQGRRFFQDIPFDYAFLDEADDLCIDSTGDRCVISGDAPEVFSINDVRLFKEYSDQQDKRELIEDNLPAAIADFVMTHPQFGELSSLILAAYLEAAKAAFEAVRNEDYIVENGHIIIIDEKTNRKKIGHYWEHGMHQMVAMKEPMVAVPGHHAIQAQMSHPTFLRKFFPQICCISGTFGDATDRRELWDIYKIVGHDVPPHRASQREDQRMTFIPEYADWIDAVAEEACKMADAGRPVLIMVDSIHETHDLREKLAARKPQIINDYDNSDSNGNSRSEQYLVDNAKFGGKITIATRVASRGSDIKPTAEALAAGGLHTIYSITENFRLQMQVAGRSARQGNEGSSHMMFCKQSRFWRRKLSREVRRMLEDVATEYGHESEQFEQCVYFARRCYNLTQSLIRREEIKREAVIEKGMEQYFDKISDAVEQFGDRPIIGTKAGLGRKLLYYHIDRLWNEGFEQLTIDALFAGKDMPFVLDLEEPQLESDTVASDLDLAFERCFGVTHQVAAQSGENWHDKMVELYQSYKVALAKIERGFSQFDESAIEANVDSLNEQVAAEADKCLDKWRNPTIHSVNAYLEMQARAVRPSGEFDLTGVTLPNLPRLPGGRRPQGGGGGGTGGGPRARVQFQRTESPPAIPSTVPSFSPEADPA